MFLPSTVEWERNKSKLAFLLYLDQSSCSKMMIYILYSRTAWLNSMGFSLARLSSHFGQCLLVIFFHALVKSLCRCGATRVDTSNGHQGESWLRQYGRWLWLDPPPQSSWTGTSVSNSQTDQKKNYFLFTAESWNCNLSRAVAGFLAGVKASHHSTDKESRDRLDLGVNIFFILGRTTWRKKLSWADQLEINFTNFTWFYVIFA